MSSKELNVSEKYSRHWPAIAIISAILSVLFYISYHLVGDVLIEGYLRLTAFGFFALAVLSFFKVRDGRMEIFMTMDEKSLEIFYRVRDKLVHEEMIMLSDVSDVEIDRMPDRSLYNDIIKSDRCIKFRRKDSEGWLYLNEIYGRVIPLSRENAEQIRSFISNGIS